MRLQVEHVALNWWMSRVMPGQKIADSVHRRRALVCGMERCEACLSEGGWDDDVVLYL